jgi:putative FmdB family regulatory protein
MPTYQYKCDHCEHIFELKMSLGADAPPCTNCNKQSRRFMKSMPGVKFKGPGFYSTDIKDPYRKNNGDFQHVLEGHQDQSDMQS